ncbi:MAG: hypothetical protein AAF236_09605, partial [Verrucomicrobiota bacterium]
QLIEAAIARARGHRAEKLIALTTQASGYLETNGFQPSGDIHELPSNRREKWAENGRNAKVLVIEL